MMHVLAFRPTFVPPWPPQSHITPLPLHRLERGPIEALVRRLAGGKKVPAEVLAHIVTKTDGVPLYVEELTKMLPESELLQEQADQYALTGLLASASIPATLQDSLMARLDRLPEAREVVQLGAVVGREFTYEMLHGLATVDEATLQARLNQLVATGLLYQRGRVPRATYIFRHALIRDAAYASLLRRRRQYYHQQVAQAERCLQQAIDTARSQHAKSLELRAVTSLARLWQTQGKRQEAHDLLAPVYHWFTEGFDTADVLTAKELLEELRTHRDDENGPTVSPHPRS